MTWSELLSMGGYAFYVWGSYAVALVAMTGEVLFLLRRKKILAAQIGDQEHSSEGDKYEDPT
jgi:heme exporter protein D